MRPRPLAMALVESAAAGLAAIERGANLVRLRAPLRSVRVQQAEGGELVKSSPVPVFVTSRVDLALACGAAGVHLVEGDIGVADARRLGPGLLVGRSVHSVDGAQRAAEEGADYMLFGPVWATPTHPGARPLGIEALRAAVRAAVGVPVLAVGGVDDQHTERCLRAGAAGWAAIRMYA